MDPGPARQGPLFEDGVHPRGGIVLVPMPIEQGIVPRTEPMFEPPHAAKSRAKVTARCGLTNTWITTDPSLRILSRMLFSL